jgi:hypothetical protein
MTGGSGTRMERSLKERSMQFVLTGFTEHLGFRVFAFEGVAAGQQRTKFTVKAELALMPRYGIRLQELPLLCRGLLDRQDEGADLQALTFTEEQMRACADERAASREAAAKKKKSPPKPNGVTPGLGWRPPQPL